MERPWTKRGNGEAQNVVLKHLATVDSATLAEMRDALPEVAGSLRTVLGRLVDSGEIERVERGLYRLAGNRDEASGEDGEDELAPEPRHESLRSEVAPPEWLLDSLRAWKRRLLLSHWRVEVSIAQDEDEDTMARVFPNPAYLHAGLVIAPALLEMPRDEAEHVIVHELLHLVLSPVDALAARCRAHLSPALRAEFEASHEDAVEAAVQMLTRSLRRGE